jgi:Pyruvate/2-oxoacid:ferredoxin oxidoreductase gamma subunit
MAAQEAENATVKLKLPPSTRRVIPFNQRSELHQAKAQSKPDPNEVAKIYVRNLEPRQKKLIAETVNARAMKKKREFEDLMQQNATMLRADSQLTSLEDFREHVEKSDKKAMQRQNLDFEQVRALSH